MQAAQKSSHSLLCHAMCSRFFSTSHASQLPAANCLVDAPVVDVFALEWRQCGLGSSQLVTQMPQTLTEPNLKAIKANADKHAEGLLALIGSQLWASWQR
jgi:hypothetical protein